MAPTTNKDVLLCVLSDMHSGSSVALFPDRFWQFKHTNHTPTRRQREMFSHFMRCADHARETRKGKSLVVVHAGDAIEGVHHSTKEVVTYVTDEQVAIHVDLMDTFLKRARFHKGDHLFYVSGTETHVMDKEERIAKDLPAEANPEGGYVFDHLELQVNGRTLWFVHHGPKRGKGPNEGNALRNWLRDIYYDALKLGVKPPDVVVSGHTHTPTYGNFIATLGDSFHVVHGIIAPSWQRKTRFAYRVAPVERNEVGAAFIEITAEGEVKVPTILRAADPGLQVGWMHQSEA